MTEPSPAVTLAHPPAELCKRSADSYGAKIAQRMMGLKFRDNTIPSVTEFEAAAKTEHLGAIRFTPAT